MRDISNVAEIADEILVFGSSDIEHDQAFINILETCKKNNVGLNFKKLQFKPEKIWTLLQRRVSRLVKINFKQSRTLKFQQMQQLCTKFGVVNRSSVKLGLETCSTTEGANKEACTFQMEATPSSST